MVEQPSAISQVSALRMERSLMIWRAVIPFFTISMTASHRQFMLLAVYIPEQLPQLGQQLQVQSSSCSSVIIPAL